MVGRVESVNVSHGGVPKAAILEGRITPLGVVGDHQNDFRHHGGPDRAVVLYSLDIIRALRDEGHPIAVGTVGENLTVSGIDWPAIEPGTALQIGDVRLQVTKYATPCRNIRASFLAEDFMRIFHDRHPGWSRVCARVLAGGIVRPGDQIMVGDRAGLSSLRQRSGSPP